MTNKIYYRLTKEQEQDGLDFIKFKEMKISLSDFMIDGFKTMAMNAMNNEKVMIDQKKLTKKEIDAEKISYNGKIPEGDGEPKAVVLTGTKILNGMILSAKISNAMTKKQKQEAKIYSTLEEYLSDYIGGQYDFIHSFLMEQSINEEAAESKKVTNDEELEAVKKNFKDKVLSE